eukprot:TRINITY_DN9746_c0_g1_i1.p1 TRINITY_DN9746_c0_g1~~TRINITY_DN9746_c0_g1_i1.p1  ORF type:complete len:752 (-),score=189.58 TRINITY_DN9746_c0_g1_i1:89-2344(-)
MLNWLVLAVLLVAVDSTQRITAVEGYPLEWIRSPQPHTPEPEAPFRPTPVPFRPLSMRVIYRKLNQVSTATVSYDRMTIDGTGLNGFTSVKLIPANAADCRTVGNVLTYVFGGTTRRTFTLPVDTEYPHEHMMQWICVCSGSTAADCANDGNANNWIHTNLRYAVVIGCDGDNSTFLSSSHVAANTDELCQDRAANLQPNTLFGEVGVGVSLSGQATSTNLLFLERKQRTQCCGWREAGLTDFGNNLLQKQFGICINPLLENCCSRNDASQGSQQAIGGIGKPYSKFREKCCYGGNITYTAELSTATKTAPEPTIISYLDDWCPCNKERTQSYCNQQVPLTAAQDCCTKTKYPELLTGYENSVWGKCFDGINMKCCDTGDLYDPGSKQCCSINGVQSLNVPCPCGSDSHCGNNQTCCMDSTRPIFPTPQESNALCNKYVNYPNGTGPYEAQPCLGQCIDTRFQICCNGMACIDAYETCCNNTCCNKFSERCTQGLRPGSKGIASNRQNFRIPFEVCTSVEALTPFRAVQAFFVPLMLLLATYISLATTLFFAKRQSTLQPLSTYEKAMFGVAVVVILFSWPLYFSPLYKYAVITIWAAFFTIFAALSQMRGLFIAAIVILGVVLVYLFDPFYGNEILTLAFERTPPQADSVHGYSGVLHSITELISNDQAACTGWYDYFVRDVNVEDQLRWDNPMKKTFGFCSRGWFVALYLFELISMTGTFLLFFVTLVTHIRNVLFFKAQKSEEVVGWY